AAPPPGRRARGGVFVPEACRWGFARAWGGARGARPSRLSRAQQLKPERRIVKAARRIDAWAEPKAHLAGAHRPGENSRHLFERADAGAGGAGDLFEAVLDQNSIRSCERDHIGDGGERHQIQHRAKSRLAALLERALLAKLLAKPEAKVEGDAGRAQMAGWILTAGLVRVDERQCRRQLTWNGVVIDDDHIQTEGVCPGHL